MNDTIMAEEMKTTPKAAFVNKPYTQEERVKRDEEELEQLMKERDGETEEAPEQEAEPTSAEEKTFKKRYSDLRRHQQKQAEEFKSELAALKSQLEQATKKEMKLPKTDEDIEQWAADYPDVAAIVETIAMKKAKEQSTALEERLKAIDEMQNSATKEKAEAELSTMHPDFEQIRSDDTFHNWAEEQPKWVQDALYENMDDAKSVSRVIDLYKTDKGISTKSKRGNSSDKAAASSVKTKGSSIPDTDDTSKYIRESEVDAMSMKEYEKRQEEILDAQRNGRFIYDMSRK